jgi:hypothetical protein
MAVGPELLRAAVRHHLHPDLKNKKMMEENPRQLWVALKECYDQQKAIFLPETR